MAYAIFRVTKHSGSNSAGSLAGMTMHNKRTIPVKNHDPSRQHLNEEIVGTGDYRADVDKRIAYLETETSEGKPKLILQKNNIRAIEHMCGASPEYFESPTEKGRKHKIEAFKRCSLEFLTETYGKDNVVSVSLHMDERTPHIHAFVVPAIEGTLKNGRKVTRLSGKKYMKNPQMLSELQDRYAMYFEEIGLERGRKGSEAHHTTVDEYYSLINDVELKHKNISMPIPQIDSKPSMFGFDSWRDEQNQRFIEETKEAAKEIERKAKQKDFLNVKELLKLTQHNETLIRLKELEFEVKKLKEENYDLRGVKNKFKKDMEEQRGIFKLMKQVLTLSLNGNLGPTDVKNAITEFGLNVDKGMER
jgi:hypothetical protein